MRRSGLKINGYHRKDHCKQQHTYSQFGAPRRAQETETNKKHDSRRREQLKTFMKVQGSPFRGAFREVSAVNALMEESQQFLVARISGRGRARELEEFRAKGNDTGGSKQKGDDRAHPENDQYTECRSRP